MESDVAQYYDSNTSRFLATNKKKQVGAIHRRLIPPKNSVEIRPEHYSESLLLEIIKKNDAKRILDVGCGVGGSIRYLRTRHQAVYVGMTLSPVQGEMARKLNTDIETGNYLNSKWYENRPPFDVIYAIESLQHNPDHNLLAQNIIQVMKPGSWLVVIDDFLTDKDYGNREERLIARFREYWHSHGFVGKSQYIELLGQYGLVFEEETDLTPLMPIPVINRHIRGLFLDFLTALPLRYAVLDNVIGGGTLLLLQEMGISGYFMLVFRLPIV